MTQPPYDPHPSNTLQAMEGPEPVIGNAPSAGYGRRAVVAICIGMLFVGACDRPATEPASVATPCAADGELVARVFGGVEGRLEWRGSELECEGMPRPHGQGARLRFAGPATEAGGADRLAFIIALPDLERGQTGKELPANVTLMEVDAGRFFSTPQQTGCWADIERQDRIEAPDAGGNTNEYRISGLLYCLSPLAELNGASSVSLQDLRFIGRLTWTEPP